MSRVPRSRGEWTWLAVLGVTAVVGAAALERTPEPAGLAAAVGFALWIPLLVLGGYSFAGPGSRRTIWVALWAASLLGLIIFALAAPAGSQSCDQATDCDTSFGLGLPFLIGAAWIAAMPLVAAGSLLRGRR